MVRNTARVEAGSTVVVLGCGGVRLSVVQIPRPVEEYLAGDLLLDQLVSRRRPLEEAAASLDDLASGGTLRELLIP